MRRRVLPALWVFSLVLTSCRTTSVANPDTTAGAQLAAAIALYEKGDLSSAREHVEKAIALAPKMVEAHLLLGRIADDMCLPNAQPGPNEPLCRLAEQEYKTVLELDASHVDALKNLAYRLYDFARVDESEAFYRRGLALYPEDPDLLCGVAAISFHRVWPDIMKVKARLNLEADAPMIQFPSCPEVREKHRNRVDEGIALLIRAMQRINDPNLIGYLSVFYRMRAEIQCGNRRAYQADWNAARMRNLARERARDQDVPVDFLQKCPPPPPPPPPPDNE